MHARKSLVGNDQIDSFDNDRLFKSVLSACLCVGRPEGQAEATANNVCKNVKEWIRERPEITTGDLRRMAEFYLKTYDSDAAYVYAQKHITI